MPTQSIALFPLLAPAALAGTALVARLERGRDPGPVLRASRSASLLALVVAIAAAVAAAIRGPIESPVLGIGEIGLSLRLDGVSTVMFVLVAFLGAVVLEYSRNYLAGDPRQAEFLGGLAGTTAAVMLLVLSGNLLQVWVAWLLTSLGLHRLLVFYPDRPGAILAARKKFIVARMADACLALAAILLVHEFGTADMGLLLSRAEEAVRQGAASPAAHLAAGLLVATAALKSAQFPVHGWLAEVMETPTPVSALLHAGILNGGPYLVVRLAPVVLLSPGALHALVIIGGFTALFASVVMVTQSTVKGVFAYSSAAHMGFMLLLCGLGLFTVAIAHLVAHSCYKAHAFLSSGSAVEVLRAARVPGGKGAPRPLSVAVALVAALATVFGIGALVGVATLDSPVLLGVAAMLAIGLANLLGQVLVPDGRAEVGLRVGVMAAATAVSFFVLEIASIRLLHGAVPEVAIRDPASIALMALVILAFGATTVLQLLQPILAGSPLLAAAWVHARNGLYANALFDRMVGGLRPAASGGTGKE